ncbi:hypothetical protein HK097_000765 [Rhizophlyctis rosea]|uniref:Uncharacterized protein n=1 Tax=Rhizophlyctis rosea TaxID=64517 RepID=A0AAD5SDB6_9FUNG|nr:hypothetical protein HK097_000765 [Rhizophlyctis rosea]
MATKAWQLHMMDYITAVNFFNVPQYPVYPSPAAEHHFAPNQTPHAPPMVRTKHRSEDKPSSMQTFSPPQKEKRQWEVNSLSVPEALKPSRFMRKPKRHRKEHGAATHSPEFPDANEEPKRRRRDSGYFNDRYKQLKEQIRHVRLQNEMLSQEDERVTEEIKRVKLTNKLVRAKLAIHEPLFDIYVLRRIQFAVQWSGKDAQHRCLEQLDM